MPEPLPPITIPLADLKRQHAALRPQLDAAVAGVIDDCDFVRGEAVHTFETEFAAWIGARFAVGVGSGTDALYLALAGGGVGDGDEVITAANSFAATAEAIVLTGATPVFADVDDETLCLDPASLEECITPRSKAVIPVHLHGHPADMDGINALARQHGLLVVEDAAQAHGTSFGGVKAGALGDVGCFSFFPSKNLGCAGDGGMVITDDEEIFKTVGVIHDHGRGAMPGHSAVGLCSRLDTIQAAMLRVKFPHLEAWNRTRAELAARYRELLGGCPDLRLPAHHEGSVYHHFAPRTPRRDGLREHLRARGIATGVHYGNAIPEEPAYARFRTVPTPVSERSCREVVSLPLFPEMREDELETVAREVRAFLEG